MDTMPRRIRQLGAALLFALTACDIDAPEEPDASPFPATGMYDVSMRVLADDCTPAYVAPAPWRQQVFAAAENGSAKVNVPLSAVPPSTSKRSAARSDFVMKADYTVRRTMQPAGGCEDLAIDYVYTLQRFSPAGFELVVDVAYGDADACAATTPTSCSTKVQYDYTLVESQCPAECTRGSRPTPRASIDDETPLAIDCGCP